MDQAGARKRKHATESEEDADRLEWEGDDLDAAVDVVTRQLVVQRMRLEQKRRRGDERASIARTERRIRALEAELRQLQEEHTDNAAQQLVPRLRGLARGD